MRKVKRWRYYCDHCSKGGCSGGTMKKHEQGCTKNPDRICGMCKAAHLEQRPIAELRAALEADLDAAPFHPSGVDGAELVRLRELTDNCPACMLAAIHAYRIDHPITSREDSDYEPFINFTFKTEAERFWADVNDREERYV